MFDTLAALPPENRWRGQTYPWPIVAALIEANHVGQPDPDGRERRYLLIRRKKNPYAGYWALIGGKWDFGETLMTAAVREAQEETGLQVRFVALRGVVNERLAPAEAGREAAHFLIFVCEVAATSGEAREQDEGAVTWFSLAQIDQLHHDGRIIPSDYAMIRRFASSVVAVPHYEAEMVEGTPEQGPVLSRFEAIGRVDGP
jgi:8-oxo-dGTP diphosphatase